jgi:anti-sigma-K factor RskA
MSGAEMHDLVALYALDALDAEERDSFERHLQDCAECEASLAENRSTATALVPDEPASAATWERISSAIATETDDRAAGVVVPLRGDFSDTVWKAVAGIAAAAAFVFAGFALLGGSPDPASSEGIVAAAEEVAAEPGTFVGDFVVEDLSVARVVLSSDGRGFVIPTEELDALDPERTYQLWVINDLEDVISAGVLGNDPAPATFTWTGEITGFALTREVAGGVISSAGDVVSVITDA